MTPPETTDPPELYPDRAPLLRSTVLAIAGSTVLLVLGGFLAAAWLWNLVRAQQQIEGPVFGIGGDSGGGASLLDRIDLVFQSAYLLAYGGLVIGAALVLRLFADMMVARLGRLGSTAPEPSIGPDTP